MNQDEVVMRLKKLLIERLRLSPERVETLALEAPLLKDGLGLDSLDCVELLLGMEEEFDLSFDETEDEWMHHFACLQTLSQLILNAKGD